MRVVLAFAVNTLFNFAIGLMVAKYLGPEEYGRFGLALAVAIVVQTALFDWVKLAATRFYSERAREANPALRATLDTAFAVLATGLAVAAIGVLLSGVEFKLTSGLIGLAIAASIANGLFDYQTALVRARFLDRHYARLVIVKNIAAFFLTGGGAFFFGSAKMALMGACLSIAGSVLSVRVALHDPRSPTSAASKGAARGAMAYALPIVAANVLYQLAPLFNRGVIADHFGFAETGQFNLAYDIGIRIVSAIGSTLDVLLFQIAVAADEHHGIEEGRAQIARNMALVFAIVLPACAGLYLVLPSIEYLVVPQQFRGPFAHYLSLLLPGLFCFAMINFAINPIFQLAKRTAPLIAAALVGGACNLALVYLLPRGLDASPVAIAQTGMFAAAFAALLGFALLARPVWPGHHDIMTAMVGATAMAAALAPLRSWTPGVGTLLLQMLLGALIYGVSVAFFDTAGLRAALLARFLAPRPVAKPQ